MDRGGDGGVQDGTLDIPCVGTQATKIVRAASHEPRMDLESFSVKLMPGFRIVGDMVAFGFSREL